MKKLSKKDLKDMDGNWGLRTAFMNKKDRNLVDVHHRLQELYKKSKARGKISSAWFKKAPKELFLGISSRPDGNNTRVLFYMSEDEQSYHVEYPDSHYDSNSKHFLRALRDSELPLYLNDSKYQGIQHQKILQGRLKREYKEIPYRQDLVDERDKLDRKSKRLWSLVHAYKKIIEEYIHKNKKANPYDSTKLLIYTIEGYTYYFNSQGDNTMFSPGDIERIK